VSEEEAADPGSPAGRAGRRARARPASRRRLLLAGLVLTVAVFGAVAWTGFRAFQIDRSLSRAQADVARLRSDLDSSDWAALRPDADRLARNATAAASATHDPLWVATTHLPWLGANPRAVSVVSQALERVARQSIVPLTMSHSLAAVAAHDAGLSALMTALDSDAAPIADAVAAVESADKDVAALDTGSLLSPIRRRVVDARDKLDKASKQIGDVGRLSTAAPVLLGQDHPRTVLLLFQTPAEPRGTGGLVGAWGELHTSKGKVSLVDFGSNDSLPNLPTAPSGVSAEIAADYGADVQLAQNFNLSASFPDAARMFAASWTAGPGLGVKPDAVVSIDPVALGDLLSVIGPVKTAAGLELTADNAADELLRKEYFTYAGADQAPRIAFLGEVTKAVFDRITNTGYSVGALGKKIAATARQGRTLIWSADPAIQAQWLELGVAGALGSPAAGSARLALNSLDGSKLGAYLSTDIAVANSCSPGPLVTITLSSAAPTAIPPYAGSHVAGLDATTMRHAYSLYVAPSWGVGSISVDGQRTAFSADMEGGWRLIRGVVDLPRASARTVAIQLVAGPGTTEVPEVTTMIAQPQAIPVSTHVARRVTACRAVAPDRRAG
jgi:hypothetical protein